MMENGKKDTVELVVFILSVLFAILGLIGAIGYNKYTEMKSLERNIESAIVKGIDPIAVKCAYGGDSWVCMQYAQTHAKPSSDTPKK
jgi:hypothetical protein